MIRKPFAEIVAEVEAAANAEGVEWYEVRNEIGRLECESGDWPEDEGMGSSDMNCLTVSRWEYDEAGVRAVIADLAWRKRTLADLNRRGVDLEAMRALFAPA